MGNMKGAAMKLGQVMSLMSGVVPEEMSSALSELHANAPAMDYRLVVEVFEREFGVPPDRLFKRFEHRPFASASIGQVHRAVLHDGQRVAVKVQYPGVEGAIEHDLANISVLVRMAGMASSGLDAGTIVRDLKEGIRAELDYQREARDQARFARLFEGHPFIRVPHVIGELTTRHVLVQEYMPGRPFRDALSLPQAKRDRIGEIIYRFAFGSLYQHRVFNGDPHPGNYLLMEDGCVAFVDYGCVTDFSEATLQGFRRVVRALIDGNRDEWRAAVEAIGILRPGAPFGVEELYDHMHWYWAPILEERVTYTPELTGEMIRRNAQTTGTGGQINRWCNVPEGMVFLTRINFGLAGVMSSIRAEGPWRGIIEEYVNGREPVTELGRLSRAATKDGRSV
jgi:predicted unusual protein kinase regulating ubiquinone biosynthesis (AarF/ABC1/UbiB family)